MKGSLDNDSKSADRYDVLLVTDSAVAMIPEITLYVVSLTRLFLLTFLSNIDRGITRREYRANASLIVNTLMLLINWARQRVKRAHLTTISFVLHILHLSEYDVAIDSAVTSIIFVAVC